MAVARAGALDPNPSRPNPWRAALLAATVLALFAAILPASANHVQTDGGKVVVFDHVTGNEWWVEVALSGQDAGSVVSVEAQDTNGPWTMLSKKSWGPYAASFRIEPGNEVRFRASWSGGAQSTSCWFTHPAGVEKCPVQPTGWRSEPIGDGGAVAGSDMAIGDPDHDGRNELYLANGQGLVQFSWTSNGWTKASVASGVPFTHVAIGDLDGDGAEELYGIHATFENRDIIERFSWNGQTWDSWSMGVTAFQDAKVGDLLIADVEPGGGVEMYWGESRQGGLITQIKHVPGGGFTQRHVTSTFWGTGHLAVADAEGDGSNELYVGTGHAEHGDVIRIAIQASDSQSTTVHTRGLRMVGLSTGDLDADGRDDLLAAHAPGSINGTGDVTWLRQGSPNWSVWTAKLPNGASPTDVVGGDADNAGGDEAYVPGNDGHLYRLRWTGSVLVTDDLMAGVMPGAGLALGDGDNDGLVELYAAGRHSGANPVAQLTNHAVAPKPAPAWHESLIGDAGGRSGLSDLAIGDGDRDGRKEVYAATRSGLFQFEWTGASWQRTQLSNHQFYRVAVGDGDRDGRVDVYASGPALNGGYEVTRFVSNGAGTWAATSIYGSMLPAGTISIGDVDDDGLNEVYIAMMPEFGGSEGSMPSYQLEFEGGNWQIRYIANVEGGGTSSWIGDADRDGDRDLYIVNDGVYRLDITAGSGGTAPGTGSAAFIGGDLGGEDNWFNGIVAGDGDRDGRQEVYVGATRFHVDASDAIYRYSIRTDGWERQVIPLPRMVSANDLALGDADNDGTQEIWFSGWDGGVWQLRWSGTAWVAKQFADVGDEIGWDLALGDVDGDGLNETYMSAYDTSRSPPHNIYRLASVAPPVSFDATFSGVRGNEWWIQASVTAAGGTLTKVDVRLNGGSWMPLAKQSWGGWAASYRAVEGTIVQLRATGADGQTDLSSCYRWIPPSNTDAAVVACTQQPPPPGFDATFSNVKGNEWWVEAKVTANEPLRSVEARVNCGPTWHALTLRSWGAWAASFHVPAGSKVDFRASSNTGHELSGGYIWPQATPTGAC